jgi:enoyl-CoA hydratase
MPESLLLERDGAVAIVTLNRPDSLNATNAELHHALSAVWQEIADIDGVRAVVLTGAGGAFSGGGDLGLLEQMAVDVETRLRVMEEARQLVLGMVALPQPIVAAVNGVAVGLGCSLASMCDLVVMEEQATFADPHVAIGLVAGDGAALTWPLQLGYQRAREWVYFGAPMSASQALELGLANRVVPTGTSVQVATELAHRLTKLPAQSLQATRQAINQPLADRLERSLRELLDAETASFDDPDFQARLKKLRARRG